MCQLRLLAARHKGDGVYQKVTTSQVEWKVCSVLLLDILTFKCSSLAPCTLSSGRDLLTNGLQMWEVSKEKTKSPQSVSSDGRHACYATKCKIMAPVTSPSAWKHWLKHTNTPSVSIWSIVKWNNVARRQTDGGDVYFWLTQWTAKVWVWSKKKKRKEISPFWNAGVESLTSSVWSRHRVHTWPKWKADIMFLRYWEWRRV